MATISLVAYMSGASTPSPFVASASSESASVFAAWKAFDASGGNPWWTAQGNPTGWLQIDLGSPAFVDSYTLTPTTTGGGGAGLMQSWTVAGSNNGTSWTTFDTQSGWTPANWPKLSNGLYYMVVGVRRSVAYRYYRLSITACNSGTQTGIGRWELRQGDVSQTITFPAIANCLTTAAPITLAATASSGLAVTYSVTGPATLSGSTLTLTGAAGTVTVTANQSGNGSYLAAPSVSRSFAVTAPAAPQTITFPALPDQYTVNAPVRLGATASSGLAVTYTLTGPGFLSIVGSIWYVTLTGGTGTCTVTASQAGNASYLPAANVSRSFGVTVAPAVQVITFAAIADKLTTDIAFALGATASSGLPVSYAVTGPATITGGILTLTGGTGTVTVTASQPGDASHAAAANVTRAFVVSSPAVQTITFPAIPDHLNTDGSFALVASASSGLPVTFVITSGPASVFGFYGSLCILTGGLGNVTVTAYQPGDSTHAAAVPVSRTFAVLPPALTPQAITFPPLADRLNGVLFTLAATASSGLAVTYTITGPATLSGNIVTVTGVGAITITAFQAGNATWAAAVPVARTFNSVALIPKNQRGNIAYNQIRASHRLGSGGLFVMASGPFASGNVPQYDPNGNLVDSGVSAQAGGTSSAGGNASVFSETPAGTIGASNTVFTLAFPPQNAALDLILNGVVQRPGVDFALSGATVTYTVAPRAGDVHTASYRR